MKKLITLFFLFILGIIFLILIFPFGYFKDELLKEVNKNSDFKVAIENINYYLISPGSFELEGLVINESGREVLKIEKIEIDVDMMALINEKLVINKAVIHGLDFKSDLKDVNEKKTKLEKLQKKPKKKKSLNELFFKELKFGEIGFVNLTAEFEKVKFNDLTFLLKNGSLKNFKKIGDSIKTEIILSSKFIQKGEYKLEDLDIKGEISEMTLDLYKIQGLLMGGRFKGEINQSLNFKEAEVKNFLKVHLESFELKNLSEVKALKKYPIIGSLEIGIEGRYNMLGKREGFFFIRGKDLNVKNINIDKLIDTFKDSQKVTAMDALGFYAMGPIGLLYSQGVNLGGALGTMGGESHIRQINFEFLFQDKAISMKDVAVRTKKNLIAIQGRVNLENKKFERLKIGFLDKRYCPELVQKIKGTLEKPEFGVGKSVFKTLVAPVTSLVNSTKELVSGCKRFYKGKVLY